MAGRPKSGENKVKFTTTVLPETRKLLEEFAFSDGGSVGELIDRLVAKEEKSRKRKSKKA